MCLSLSKRECKIGKCILVSYAIWCLIPASMCSWSKTNVYFTPTLFSVYSKLRFLSKVDCHFKLFPFHILLPQQISQRLMITLITNFASPVSKLGPSCNDVTSFLSIICRKFVRIGLFTFPNVPIYRKSNATAPVHF